MIEKTLIEAGSIATWLITIILYFYWILAIFVILTDEDRDSHSVITWLAIFFIFPIIGFIAYLLFGYNHRRKKMIQIKRPPESKTVTTYNKLVASFEKEHSNLLEIKDLRTQKIAILAKNCANAVITVHNSIKIFHTGKEKFDSLYKDIERAKKFIHMDYFIWNSDSLTEKFKNILIEKARDGVEVRIIIDSIGALRIKRSYLKEMQKNNIKIHLFYNVFSPTKIFFFNHRSHRKIVIIDGVVGYTGGMNMGKEYIDGKPRFKSWRDTHMRITGEAVLLLQKIFIENWYDLDRENLYHKRYFPYEKSLEKEKIFPMQIVHSGPDTSWAALQKMYFSLITSATNYVYIHSPYFVPDRSILTALSTAALSGIDVRIIVTGIPDKKIPYWAAFTYFKDILRAGGKVYHYNAGFMHTKSIVVDDEIGSIGTTNMDIRSFRLNYEVNALFYNKNKCREMRKVFLADTDKCREYTWKDYENTRVITKLRNSLARLTSPLL
ncbi:MAG: cardiolipin synthase [Candidatus Moraniibacteriota bacterium]|nr:MAG: cardiolipin synthase [Candidatus Moranbacteria bacterium]